MLEMCRDRDLAECVREKILKIGQYFMQLWQKLGYYSQA